MVNQLKVYRAKKGYTQEDTAKACDISLQMYSQIEQGYRRGSLSSWESIQKALDIPDSEMWAVIRSVVFR